MNHYQKRADALYAALVAQETTADHDQLFFCSYLLGHVSLISTEQGDSALQFEQNLQHSLDAAFQVDRLSEQDKAAIIDLRDTLLACAN